MEYIINGIFEKLVVKFFFFKFNFYFKILLQFANVNALIDIVCIFK